MLGDDVRLEHVGVEGVTSALAYPKGEFHPCVVADMTAPNSAREAVFNGRRYQKWLKRVGLCCILFQKINRTGGVLFNE